MSKLLLNPWSRLDHIFDDFNQVFGQSRESFPKVDTYKDESAVYLQVDLPGVDPKAVELTYKDDTLTLKGTRKDKEIKGVKLVRQQRNIGDFERTFILPYKINESAVHAGFKNGLLSVKLPKEAEAKAKKIMIKTQGAA